MISQAAFNAILNGSSTVLLLLGYAAIRAGKLQYRPGEIYGNPWLRLLRREVEELVSSRHGEGYLRERQARTELKRINRQLKQLRAQVAELEQRRSVLLAELGEQKP